VNYTLHFGQVLPYLPYLLGGAVETILLSVLAFAGGMVIGAVGAAAATWGGATTRRISGYYVTFFTNTPALVQVYFIYFVLPDFGIVLSSFNCVLIGLVLNSGAYLTEVQRAGFRSVPRTEIEAAETIGLSKFQTTWHVVMPHVVRTLYPALTGQFILVTLGSSIGAVFGVDELTGRAFGVNSETFRAFEVFIVTGLLYVGVTLLATTILAWTGWLLFRARVRVL